MSTYTDLHKRLLKETINVNYDDRLTEQKLRLSNDQNEYWGSFHGKLDVGGVSINGGNLLSVYIESVSSYLSNATIENGTIHNVTLSDDVHGAIDLGTIVEEISQKVLSIEGFDTRLIEERDARVANDKFLSDQIDLKENASHAAQEHQSLKNSIDAMSDKVTALSTETKDLSDYIIQQIQATSSFVEEEAQQLSLLLSSQTSVDISAMSWLLSTQLQEVSSFIRRDEAIVSSYTFDNISAVSSYLQAHSSDLSGDTLSALSSLSAELSTISSEVLIELSSLSTHLCADIENISSDVQFLLSVDQEGMRFKGIPAQIDGNDVKLSAFIGQQLGIHSEDILKLGNFYAMSAEQSALYDADNQKVSLSKSDFFIVNKDVFLSAIKVEDLCIIKNSESALEQLRQDLTSQISAVSSSVSSSLYDQISTVSSDLTSQISAVSSDFSTQISVISCALSDEMSAVSSSVSSSLYDQISAISSNLSTQISAASSDLTSQISVTSSDLSTQISAVSSDLISSIGDLSIQVSAVSCALSNEMSAVSSYIINQVSAVSSYQAENISSISTTLCSLVSSEYFILSADNSVSGNQVFAGTLSAQVLSAAEVATSSLASIDTAATRLSVKFDSLVDDINGIPLASRIKQQENPSLVAFAQRINKMIACAGLDHSKAINLEEDLLEQLKTSIIYIHEIAGCETPIDDNPTIGQAGLVIEEALDKLTFTGTHITLQQCLDDLSCNIDDLAAKLVEVSASCDALSIDLSEISADLVDRIDSISGDFGKVSADVYESAKASFVWLSGDNTVAKAHAISGANDFVGETFVQSLSVAQLKGIGSNAFAEGNRSIAIGSDVSAKAANAFAWNGTSEPYIVTEEKEGTFCINPVGELEGVYVGSKSISAHLSGAIETSTRRIDDLSTQLSAIADAIRNDSVLSNGIADSSDMRNVISAVVLIFSQLSSL